MPAPARPSPCGGHRPWHVQARHDNELEAVSPGSAPGFTVLPPGLASLRCFREEYEALRYISSGSYGDVWVCRERATGDEYACKVLRKAHMASEAQREEVRREVQVMSALKSGGGLRGDADGGAGHPGVVALHDVMETAEEVQLVMELCPGGDLYSLLVSRGPLPEASSRAVFRQVASALAHCHARGVLHRDVKPENILLDREAGSLYSYSGVVSSRMAPAKRGTPAVQAKLADFGLSVQLACEGSDVRGCAGSLFYVAPEMLREQAYGVKADVWSLGVTLCALLTARLPFTGPGGDEDRSGLVQAILRGKVDWGLPHWRGVSPQAKSLILLLLEQDPEMRPTVAEVLQHPWLADSAGPSPPLSASKGPFRQAGRPRVKAFTAPLAPRADPAQRLSSRAAVRASTLLSPSPCTCTCQLPEASCTRATPEATAAAEAPAVPGAGSGRGEATTFSPLRSSSPDKENHRANTRKLLHRRLRSSLPEQAGSGDDSECVMHEGVTPRSRRIGNLILRSIQAC